MATIKRIWHDIHSGHNLDVYLTVLLALIIAILGAFQIVNEAVIFSAVLAVLALISINLLTNRHSNENLQALITKLENSDNLAKKLLKQNFDPTILKPAIRNEANLLLYWVANATSTVPLLKDDIEFGLQRGLEAKLMFIEPNSEVAKMYAFRNRYQEVDEVNSVLQMNFLRLANIVSNNPSGKLEVRVINYLPPFGIIATDPNLPTGHMFVRLMTFRIPNDQRPYLELTSKNDKEWFDFFVNQFDAVWSEATPVDLMNLNSNKINKK